MPEREVTDADLRELFPPPEVVTKTEIVIVPDSPAGLYGDTAPAPVPAVVPKAPPAQPAVPQPVPSPAAPAWPRIRVDRAQALLITKCVGAAVGVGLAGWAIYTALSWAAAGVSAVNTWLHGTGPVLVILALLALGWLMYRRGGRPGPRAYVSRSGMRGGLARPAVLGTTAGLPRTGALGTVTGLIHRSLRGQLGSRAVPDQGAMAWASSPATVTPSWSAAHPYSTETVAGQWNDPAIGVAGAQYIQGTGVGYAGGLTQGAGAQHGSGAYGGAVTPWTDGAAHYLGAGRSDQLATQREMTRPAALATWLFGPDEVAGNSAYAGTSAAGAVGRFAARTGSPALDPSIDRTFSSWLFDENAEWNQGSAQPLPARRLPIEWLTDGLTDRWIGRMRQAWESEQVHGSWASAGAMSLTNSPCKFCAVGFLFDESDPDGWINMGTYGAPRFMHRDQKKMYDRYGLHFLHDVSDMFESGAPLDKVADYVEECCAR